MTDVMIDIETLGTTPGCAILSIAAVPFNTLAPLEHFYERISQQSCIENQLHVDAATVDWWSHQSVEAQKEAFGGTERIEMVLFRFSHYIKSIGNVRVWGNGASFDVPILEAAYNKCAQPYPWKYFNSMCFRTLTKLYPAVKYIKPKDAHNALSDAKAQAEHAEKIFKLYKLL